MREKDLYPSVERWLRSTHGCFDTGVDTGLATARIDVVGLRDLGDELTSTTEVVAIEVKRAMTPFGNAVGQAHGYSVYADRCYLADMKSGAFTPAEVRIASHLGVGLLHITLRDSGRHRVEEVLAAPIGRPLPEMRLQLAEKLGYSECTICRSLFERGDASRAKGQWSKKVVRTGVREGAVARAVQEEKGLVYWMDELDKRTGYPKNRNHFRRYVCPDCLWSLFRDFAD